MSVDASNLLCKVATLLPNNYSVRMLWEVCSLDKFFIPNPFPRLSIEAARNSNVSKLLSQYCVMLLYEEYNVWIKNLITSGCDLRAWIHFLFCSYQEFEVILVYTRLNLKLYLPWRFLEGIPLCHGRLLRPIQYFTTDVNNFQHICSL